MGIDKKEEVKESQNFLFSNEDNASSRKKNLGILSDSQEDLDEVAPGENVLEGKINAFYINV